MDTKFPEFDFTLETLESHTVPQSTSEIILPYHIRAMFRPKLQEFFEQSNKHSGSYLKAELAAKTWFLDNMQIPFEAWEYRK